MSLLTLNGGLMTVLLAVTRGGIANRFLAALVGLISLRLLIYVLGFAGLYDEHPWITFAPLDLSFAFGPLLWLYVATLTRGAPPERWRWHLLPAAVQLTYWCVAFTLPTGTKLWWYRGPHLEIVAPLGLAVLLCSCVIYLLLAWRRQRDFQHWLDAAFSDRDRWRLGWLSAVLAAFAATLVAALAAALINLALTPLDYFARAPVVIASSLLAYALGLLGWKNAALDLPAQQASDAQVGAPGPSRPAAAFQAWAQRIEMEQWWLEEGLTLAAVAGCLGTSERTLSRALSEGGGCNFNALINRMRVDAVMRAIDAGARGDLLGVALDCGFSSKASFNRAFLRHVGVTPSAWRASLSQDPPVDVAGAT